MAKYLIEAAFTPEGVTGLTEEGGSCRTETVAEIVRELGGTVDAFYYAFGTTDAYVIVDLPTPSNAVAFSLALSSAGAVGVKTHVLVTPEEVDQAAIKGLDARGQGPRVGFGAAARPEPAPCETSPSATRQL